jgi:hypothetical protein
LLISGTFFARKMRDSNYLTMIDPFTQKYGRFVKHFCILFKLSWLGSKRFFYILTLKSCPGWGENSGSFILSFIFQHSSTAAPQGANIVFGITFFVEFQNVEL